MPAFPRRIGNFFDRPADNHDTQFRDLLREARKLAKLTFDPKTEMLKGRVGLKTSTYTSDEFDRASNSMAKTFTTTDPGMRLTWRTRLLTMATEEELKEIWHKIKALRLQTFVRNPAIFGLETKSDEEEGVDESEGDRGVVVELTDDFIGGMIDKLFEAMGCVFAGVETKNEWYIHTCDTIEKLLQGETITEEFDNFTVVRSDIDDATMTEVRAVAHKIAGHFGRRSGVVQSQPNTARGPAAPPSSVPNSARGSNPTPYPMVSKIVPASRGAPTAIPPTVPALATPVLMRGTDAAAAEPGPSSAAPPTAAPIATTHTNNGGATHGGVSVNPLSTLMPTSARPALPPRTTLARPAIPGMGGSGSAEKYVEGEYTRADASREVRSRIEIASFDPFAAPTCA